MNVIIPIGGTGQRFKEENYYLPKPLINVLGKPMIYRVINSLKLNTDDNIIIIYNNQLKDFNFESLINFYFPNKNIKFITLNHLTKGAAETVLIGLNEMSLKELNNEYLLIDCDTFYEEDIISLYKESQHKNSIFYSHNTDPKPIFSYIKTQKNEKIIEIKEKNKISDKANTGAYGFENGHLLKKYCKKILNNTGEPYISHAYNEMLKENIEVYGIKIDKFNCVGTPLQLKVFCNKNKHKSEKLRMCFDLDNTLVSYPKEPGNYNSVEPINKNIQFLRLLKELGHTIIIYTARRMKTHSGNIGGVVADIGKITLNTLEEFNIPYDEIYFGKPYANFYIDDLAINPMLSLDKSLGIFNTHTTPRDFNKIEYKDDKVIKFTSNKGEVFWYQNIPEDIKDLFPKVYEAKNNNLVLENIEGINYSYLYINKNLNISDLTNLFQNMERLHQNSNSLPNTYKDIYSNYVLKLTNRYYKNKSLYNRIPFSKKIFNTLNKRLREYEDNNQGNQKIIHGDPVFTNILKTKTQIKFIDMRGKLGDEMTLEGDIWYDYAKIYQSIIGYDFILNDIEIDNIYIHPFIKHFESQFNKEELYNIKTITASLLFTLLPLHTYSQEKFNKYLKLINNLINES